MNMGHVLKGCFSVSKEEIDALTYESRVTNSLSHLHGDFEEMHARLLVQI